MKPEELDRLFREELEKLEQVPGVEWNDDSAWNKINSSLQGGWNSGWTWSISVITVVTSFFLLYKVMHPNENSIAAQKDIKVTIVTPVKIDSVKTKAEAPEKKEIVSSVKKKSVPVSNTPVIPVEPIAQEPADTIPENILPETRIDYYAPPYLNTYRFPAVPNTRQLLNFTMPPQSVYRMSVNNSFNLPNLLKSIDAQRNSGQNFYYLYEYNYYLPRQSVHPYLYPGVLTPQRSVITTYPR